MIEDAAELSYHLPLSFKTESEREYITFLWEAFESNYKSEKYEFSGLAFHLLYMSFISFSVWRIRSIREHDFKQGLIGFLPDAENKLLTADTPFKFYETLKESQIFRFLKLIGCENDQVGEFSKFVKHRNKIAHPSGTVFFNDRVTIETEISEILQEVAHIHQHMCPIVQEVYVHFLEESANPEEWEYADPLQEIEANLIHRNYLSQKDIDICLDLDITSLKQQPGFENICSLHQALKKQYGTD